MVDAAICNGDYVVIRQQPTADNGDIVAAMIDGEATVKTFQRKDGKVWLLPHNDGYEPIDGTARHDPRQGDGGPAPGLTEQQSAGEVVGRHPVRSCRSRGSRRTASAPIDDGGDAPAGAGPSAAAGAPTTMPPTASTSGSPDQNAGTTSSRAGDREAEADAAGALRAAPRDDEAEHDRRRRPWSRRRSTSELPRARARRRRAVAEDRRARSGPWCRRDADARRRTVGRCAVDWWWWWWS